MRVLGVDPGLNVTGYGVVDAGKPIQIVEAGVIRGRTGTLPQRIRRVYDGIVEVCRAYQPQIVCLEEVYSHYRRPRTAILMGHVRGAICLAAAQAELDVVAYSATRVKKLLTGSGRAGKADMQRAVCRELHLAVPPEPHDVADALAIAMTHLFLQKTVSIPQ